jgi:hypothetical protein
VGWRSLLTRWLLPNLLPLFPAVFVVIVVQGLLLAAAISEVPFWPGGVQRIIGFGISYGIFLWVLGLVPALLFLTVAPILGGRLETRWRPLATVGLAVAIGASTLASMVALLTGGGFASHFVLIAPIWILYGIAVQVSAAASFRRSFRAALAGLTIGALTLALPFIGIGGLLWAGLLIGDGRRLEAGWLLATGALMPAILFASALAVDPPPPLAVALASFSLGLLGVGIGLIVLGGRRVGAAEADEDETPPADAAEPGQAQSAARQPRPRQGR